MASRHPVVTVVSQPDRGRGRGRKRSPSPVSAAAEAAGIPLLRPERVGDAETLERLKGARPDLGVVVAFGQFIPKPVRTLPALGYLINGHASLLPRYRGAAPVAQAILDGEKTTGVSVMRVEKEMDAGPVALVESVEIGEQENTGELTQRLAALAGDVLLEAVEEIAEGRIRWTEQDHSRATVAAKISRDDAQIDWTETATSCMRRVHAMAPKPGAFGRLLDGRGEATDLRIVRARALEAGQEEAPEPGVIRLADGSDAPPLRIGTGEGWLVPLEVQRPGGKVMDPAAFLRGNPLEAGSRFATHPGARGSENP